MIRETIRLKDDKTVHAAIVETSFKGHKNSSNMEVKRLIEDAKKNGIDKEDEKELRQLLLSGIVFEDLKNEIRELLEKGGR